MNFSGALVTVVMKPPVISSAMPRPASISTSVAMIGWIPTTATRNPFQTPSRMASPMLAAIATRTVLTLPGSGRVGDDRQR